MSEPEKKLKNGCISDEMFNLAIDGEYAFSGSEHEHLDNCEACRQRYDEFRKLDRLLFEHWELPGEGISVAAMRFNVQRKLAEQRRYSAARAFRPVAAAAGIMLIAGLVLFFHGNISPFRKPAATMADATTEQQGKPAANEFPFYATHPAAVDRVGLNAPNVRSGNEGAMPLGSLVPVDSAGNNVMFNYLTDLIDSSRLRPVEVDSEVAHIWVAENPAAAAEALPRLLRQCGVNAAAVVVVPRASGGTDATVELTKAQLLRFVRLAAWNDWELLSSQQPQPESVIAVSEQDKPVHYSIKLLPSGK
ncbi:MAG: anti-sigma factor [Victivallaceae bacterium]|nr:hypothetical protein [Victivallaceae bacterium]